MWPDGSKYVGTFHDGTLNGHGVVTFADGGRLEGDFVDCDPRGEVTYVTAAGELISGAVWQASPDPSAPGHRLPGYPGEMIIGLHQAEPSLTMIIDEHGNVASATVDIPSSHYTFDKLTIESVAQWKYLPATIDGRPVKTILRAQVGFKILRLQPTG